MITLVLQANDWTERSAKLTQELKIKITTQSLYFESNEINMYFPRVIDGCLGNSIQ